MATRRFSRALPLISLLSGCSFDVAAVDFAGSGPVDGPLGDAADALTVFDLAASLDLFVAPDIAGTCGSRNPTHVNDLAEGDLSNWTADAPMPWFGQIPPSLKVEADNKGPARGLISVRLTDSTDQGVLTYPKAKNAAWNLSAYTALELFVAADDSSHNNDPGWQVAGPQVTLATSANDYFTYSPSLNQTPRDPGTWISLEIPLSGGGGWSRSTTGNPSLSNINYISFAVDTWGFGFKLWLDGVTFAPAPFVDCTP
jgi:hypothetical protein